MLRHLATSVILAVVALGVLAGAPRQTTPILPVDEVRPGMVGIGRTVFADDRLEEFRVTIVGVMRNVMGPRRDLILARLEGGPLANTGVIQGMSGSPVYVDGKLVGAVSYSLGSFPKEPLAGITPIEEMIADVDAAAPSGGTRAALALAWPATSTEVFAALGRIATRAASPLGSPNPDLRIVGHVGLHDQCRAVRLLHEAGGLLGLGLRPRVVDHDRCAFPRVRDGDLAAHPDSRAGDYGDLSRELRHRRSLACGGVSTW